MDLTLDEDYAGAADPMDTVEHVIGSDDRFTAERAEDGDVHFMFKSAWAKGAHQALSLGRRHLRAVWRHTPGSQAATLRASGSSRHW